MHDELHKPSRRTYWMARHVRLRDRSRIEGAGHGFDNVLFRGCSGRREHFFVDYAVKLPPQRDEQSRIPRWGIKDNPVVDADLTLLLIEHQLTTEHHQCQLRVPHRHQSVKRQLIM